MCGIVGNITNKPIKDFLISKEKVHYFVSFNYIKKVGI